MIDDWIYLNSTIVIRRQGCGDGGGGCDGDKAVAEMMAEMMVMVGGI